MSDTNYQLSRGADSDQLPIPKDVPLHRAQQPALCVRVGLKLLHIQSVNAKYVLMLAKWRAGGSVFRRSSDIQPWSDFKLPKGGRSCVLRDFSDIPRNVIEDPMHDLQQPETR